MAAIPDESTRQTSTTEPSNGATKGYSKTYSRKINFEEAIRRQIDRIAYLRTTGQDWLEALETLSDLVIPYSDAEFEEDWEDRPVRGVKDREGRWRLAPTPQDQRHAFRIIMRLLKRRGVLFREQNVSWARGGNPKTSEGPT